MGRTKNQEKEMKEQVENKEMELKNKEVETPTVSKVEEENKEVEVPVLNEEEIPVPFRSILKVFKNHEYLYLNSKGCVFVRPFGNNTKKYKNPYFSK